MTIEETHKDGVDRTILTLSTGGHGQDVKAMLEPYDDLIDQDEPQNDQETTRNDKKNDQENSEPASSDQKLTTGDQIADQKIIILNLIKSNPNITRSEITKTIGLHDSSIKRRLESLISEGLIRRVGSTKGGHWEIS